jgi:hypothetical protein
MALNAITLPRALKILLPFPAGMTLSPVIASSFQSVSARSFNRSTAAQVNAFWLPADATTNWRILPNRVSG